MEQLDGVCETAVRIVAAQHGAWSVSLVSMTENDRRRARVAQQGVITAIGDEGQITRPCLLDAGDPDDVDVARGALEAAV